MGKISRTWCNSGAYLSSIARDGRTNEHRLAHRQLEFGKPPDKANRRLVVAPVPRTADSLAGTGSRAGHGNRKKGEGRGRFGITTGNVQVSSKLQSRAARVCRVYARRCFAAYRGQMKGSNLIKDTVKS
jgi:hypothetical protein